MNPGEADTSRTTDSRPLAEGPFCLGDWVVDPASHVLQRAGNEVRLEPKVMKVLVFLAGRRGQVVSRYELESGVWAGMIVTDDAVTNTVIKLRRALGDNARDPRYIETIAKSGYRLIAEVASLPPTQGEPAATSPAGAVVPRPDRQTEPAVTERPRLLRWHVLLVGLLLPVVVILVWLAMRPSGTGPELGRSPPDGPPVVAVMPFENLSADPEQDYFVDGVTEDLITDLSRLSGLQVVARNSVLAYRGSREPLSRISRELGARFIVQGSVQRMGPRLRINVRLSDALEGRNRWAERYDRELVDIFRIQDEITGRVVSALRVELAPDERHRLARQHQTTVEAYDLYLRGLDLLGRRSAWDITEAKRYFERAIAHDPGFARAYASLAQAHSLDAVYGLGERVGESLARAEVVARQAEAIDDSLPQLRFVMSQVRLYRGDLAGAAEEISRAIELRPSYADAYAMRGWILHFSGRTEEGLQAVHRATALNPQVPAIYRMVLGALHYQLGRTQDAVRLLRESVSLSPNQMLARLFLSAACAASGEIDAAAWEVAEMQTLDPGFDLRSLEHGFPIRDARYRERLIADLRRAGLVDRGP